MYLISLVQCLLQSKKAINFFRSILIFSALTTHSLLQADTVEDMYILIPGGTGGGWDSTGRAVGEALHLGQLLNGEISFENLSGNGGGKAVRLLMEEKSDSTKVMVNSTPIILRNLTGVFPEGFRDLTPIAGLIGDYGALVVTNRNQIKNFSDLLTEFKSNPSELKVAGGSLAGGMDHLVIALALKSAGVDPNDLVYKSYDGGGSAMKSLLLNETQVLSTGLSEALALAAQGSVRVLVTTAPNTIKGIPSLRSEGYDAEFVNWRGLFGPPTLTAVRQKKLHTILRKMQRTESWERIRDKNSWINLLITGKDFTIFLEQQETLIRSLLTELGFIDS